MAETRVTFCQMCAANCGVRVTVDDGRIAAIAPDPDHPLSRGHFCLLGRAATDLVDDSARLNQPLCRVDGRFVPVAWSAAVDEIAARLLAIRARWGPRALALYWGGGHLAYPTLMLANGFMKGFGSPNTFSATSIDCAQVFLVAEKVYGNPLFLTLPDVAHTRCLLLFGSNPAVTGLSQTQRAVNGWRVVRKMRQAGGTFILVDPRRSESADEADIYASIRPGTDVCLIFGLIHVILGEGLWNRAFVERWVSGLEEIRAVAAGFPPAQVERLTGVPAAQVQLIARTFAAAPCAVAVGRSGVSLSHSSTLGEWGIVALNALTGNIDRAGSVYFNRGPIDLPKLSRGLLSSEALAGPRIGDYEPVLGGFPAATLADEILTPGDGQVRALIVLCGNPLVSFPNVEKLRRALATLDLLVVIDLFMNDTAQAAHFVLPAASFLEREEYNLAANHSHAVPFAQFVDRVVPPRAERREDWEILRAIGARAGIPLLGSRALDRVARAVDALDAYLGLGGRIAFHPRWLLRLALLRSRISFRKLRRARSGLVLGDHGYGRFLPRLQTPDGRICLAVPEFVSALDAFERSLPADPVYPFRLIGRRERYVPHAPFRALPRLRGRIRETNYAELSPADFRRYGILEDEEVCVRSPTGAIRIRARPDPRIPPGIVCIPIQWGYKSAGQGLNGDAANAGVEAAACGANGNVLVSDRDLDPFTGLPRYNGTPCRIESLRECESDVQMSVGEV